MQTVTWDAKAGIEARDAGIAASDFAACSLWKRHARRAVEHVMNEKPDGFTVDDVQARLRFIGVSAPSEGRAMGAIMVAAAKAGKIKRVGYVPTTQVRSHRSPTTLWSRA